VQSDRGHQDAVGDQAGDQLEVVRDAARELASEGQIEVTQQGEAVDLDAARGPIRLRRADPPRSQIRAATQTAESSNSALSVSGGVP
jgi:uncharacterized protein DUF3253